MAKTTTTTTTLMDKDRANTIAGIVSGVFLFKTQRKDQTLAEAVVKAGIEYNVTLEEAEEVIKEGKNIIGKAAWN